MVDGSNWMAWKGDQDNERKKIFEDPSRVKTVKNQFCRRFPRTTYISKNSQKYAHQPHSDVCHCNLLHLEIFPFFHTFTENLLWPLLRVSKLVIIEINSIFVISIRKYIFLWVLRVFMTKATKMTTVSAKLSGIFWRKKRCRPNQLEIHRE